MGGGDTRNRAVWRPASAVPVVAALLLAVSPAPVQGAKASWISGIDYKERTIPHGSTAGGTTMSITCSNDCVPFAGLQATNTSGWHGSILLIAAVNGLVRRGAVSVELSLPGTTIVMECKRRGFDMTEETRVGL